MEHAREKVRAVRAAGEAHHRGVTEHGIVAGRLGEREERLDRGAQGELTHRDRGLEAHARSGVRQQRQQSGAVAAGGGGGSVAENLGGLGADLVVRIAQEVKHSSRFRGAATQQLAVAPEGVIPRERGRAGGGGDREQFPVAAATGQLQLGPLPHPLVGIAQQTGQLERGTFREPRAQQFRGPRPQRVPHVLARVDPPEGAEPVQRVPAHPVDHHQ